MSEMIPVTRSAMPDFDEYVREIEPIWRSRWLTNMGEKHNELQSLLTDRLGVDHVSLFTNGHLALEAAIRIFDFPYGSEIITTPFTFASTTNAILRCGCVPVFCDIDEQDFTIDPDKVESLINEKTVAILPVHVYGRICSVQRLEDIASKHGLKLIFDAAHAFNETIDGKGVGSFGDISMFSFHATKVFHTIEGGCLCYMDDSLTRAITGERNYGLMGTPDTYESVGGNSKMNEFQAAMGLCNLRHLDEMIEKRKNVTLLYKELLSGISGVYIPKEQPGVISNYAYFPVVFDGYRYSRDEIVDRLKNENIFARKYFYPATNRFQSIRDRIQVNDTPIAEHVSENVLTLPLYPDLDSDTVKRIAKIILS